MSWIIFKNVQGSYSYQIMCKFSNVSANYQISSVQLKKKKHFLKIIFVMVTHVLYCTQNVSKLCINMLAVPGWGNAFGFSIFILCSCITFCFVMLCFFLSFFCGVLLCFFLSFVVFFYVMLCHVMFVCFFCGYPNRLSYMRAQQYFTTMLNFYCKSENTFNSFFKQNYCQ